ncbi:DUF3570 domain-containing protein [Flavilitoribacter nigricans]|uniref:DUF3570 domain-containing protein n=1 Tax=Flavilitoribacter nigricans (strain ATCC 23147 / DSM 23189 / NBRC 102662 / NCIMB 1420 / SS-2) TaxID=1122177 RepID=A0A2D0NCB6_FLAN2|nr:DUF3570 domain-containing protein [Flavilitoribacter nigricans]PHN06016.1 hypothetical protein CRP01_13685 [Flavilitoribacter nigricans DSM 23189 = NBRC 102662]
MNRYMLALIVLAGLWQLASAQSDTSAYQKKKLQVEEVNLLFSFYQQDGDNSAVTGGIGSEQLTDAASVIKVKLSKEDRQNRAHEFNVDLGIDYYTSASSDKIDPATISSASSADTRVYPTLSWLMTDEQKRYRIGASTSFSHEYDYNSFGLGFNIAKFSADHNRELGLNLQAYFDQWQVIYPIEVRRRYQTENILGLTGSGRNSFSASLVYSQVINRRLQVALMADGVYQQGLLSTPFNRVYFEGQEQAEVEKLPDSRWKLPLGIRANYFLSDFLVARAYYRYYVDQWGIKAHTASLELPVKINSFFSVYPFYRYYTQTQADYFAPYGAHQLTDTYYTSDYDISAFNSHFYGAGLRYGPPNGIFDVKAGAASYGLKMIEFRYGHYERSTQLQSDIFSIQLKFGRN